MKDFTPQIEYVAGFLFSRDLKQIALIKKTKPKWQAGKFNGIGGKIERARVESSREAMVREFKEETGVEIEEPYWHKFAELRGMDGIVPGQQQSYTVHFFWSVDERIDDIRSMTEEQVVSLPVHWVVEGCTEVFVSNLAWLVPMALNQIKNDSPHFALIQDTAQLNPTPVVVGDDVLSR